MTEEFRKSILKHIPTRLLVKAYIGRSEIVRVMGEEFQYYEPIRIVMGKFAYWNPYKGHNALLEYNDKEVKEELDTREHVKRRNKKHR